MVGGGAAGRGPNGLTGLADGLTQDERDERRDQPRGEERQCHERGRVLGQHERHDAAAGQHASGDHPRRNAPRPPGRALPHARPFEPPLPPEHPVEGGRDRIEGQERLIEHEDELEQCIQEAAREVSQTMRQVRYGILSTTCSLTMRQTCTGTFVTMHSGTWRQTVIGTTCLQTTG